jgi:hypothetical protein
MTSATTAPRTPAVGPASPTLSRVLDGELVLSPSIQGMYSSHLAMALVALEQMGAPPDLLESTLDRHLGPGAELRDDTEVLDERLREVARDGIAATVRTRAAALVDGPGTALYHPVIRLAYALDVGHEGQVAAALLDWERRHDVLPLPAPTPGDRRLPDAAADLAAHPSPTWPVGFDLHGIARNPDVRIALEGLALDEHTLDDVSTFALAAHLAADDFVTLHMVTGARAVRAVGAWLDPGDAARLAAASALVMTVAFAAVGAPSLLDGTELDAVRSLALPSRDEIARRAIADRDPHVIKLANVALVEEERTGDLLYRFIAARVVGLVPDARSAIAPDA